MSHSVTKFARRYGLGLSLVVLACTVVSSAALASTTEIVTEPGTEVSVTDSGWITDGNSAPCLTAGPTSAGSPIPGCAFASPDDPGSGVIDLTPNLGVSNAIGEVVYDRPVSADLGLHVSFDESQFGGSGGDGLSFFLVDGSHSFTPVSGSYGLYGYGPRLRAGGVTGGLMGVTLDVSGTASGFDADGGSWPIGGGLRHDCSTTTPAPGNMPDAVVLRGMGDTFDGGYCYVAGTAANALLLHGVDRLSATHHVVVDVSPSTAADPRVVVTVDGTTLIDVPTSAVTKSDYPGPMLTTVSSYRFGFGASGSGGTDHHDIWNIQASTQVSNPPLLSLAIGGGPFSPGSTGNVTLTASAGALGGAENTPLVATAALPAGVTVESTPTGTGWDCAATIVGSRSVSCTYAADSSNVLAAGTSTPAVTVPVAVWASADIGPSLVSGALTDGNSPSVTATSAGVDIWGTQLKVVRSADRPTYTAAGQLVTLSYRVTNQTSGTVTSVVVADTLSGATTPNCPQASLAAGASETCTSTYSTTQSDIDAARSLTGTGSATALDGLSQVVTSANSSAGTVVAAPTSRIAVAITSQSRRFKAGQTITYQITVTNTGTTTLHRVGIATQNLQLVAACPATPLVPGAATICTATHAVTRASVKAGKTVCRLTMIARDPLGARLFSVPASLTIKRG